GTKPPLEEL
nr:Chain Q, Podoplanin [Mus musculus]3IET_X Chain X, Podoplanin [Mus musculus]